jgi:hypothetical protein
VSYCASEFTVFGSYTFKVGCCNILPRLSLCPQLRHRDKSHCATEQPPTSPLHIEYRHNARAKCSVSREDLRQPLSARHHRAPLRRRSFFLHMHTLQHSVTTTKLSSRPAHLLSQRPRPKCVICILASRGRRLPSIASATHMERLLCAPPNAPPDRAGLLHRRSRRRHLLRPHHHDGQRL